MVSLGVVVLAAVALAYSIWRGLDALDPGVAAALIAATATVLISVVSLILQRRWEQRRAIEEAQREHKRHVYEEYIQFLFRSVTDPPGQDEIQRFVQEFSPKLILWGAGGLVSEYTVRFAGLPMDSKPTVAKRTPEILFAFERVLYSVRRDLGYANTGLQRGDLLRLFITDVDDYLRAVTEDRTHGAHDRSQDRRHHEPPDPGPEREPTKTNAPTSPVAIPARSIGGIV